MTNNKSHIKHHYVPQCYLKHFGQQKNNSKKGDEYFLYAYDLKRKRSMINSVEDVCYIRSFYSISDKSIIDPSRVNNLSIEIDLLANEIEYKFDILLNGLKERLGCYSNPKLKKFPFQGIERFLLAKQVVIQYLRMPRLRKLIVELYKRDYPKLIEIYQLLKAQITPDALNVKFNISYDEALIHAEGLFLNEELIDNLAKKLISYNWVFCYSQTMDICTSDNPIVICSHKTGYPKEIWDDDIIIYFPLYPCILLCMTDMSDDKTHDCDIGEISVFAYESFHRLLSLQSEKIFNFNNKFDFIKNCINE